MQQLIVRQEESRFRSTFGIFEIGLGMCLPTLMAYGSEAPQGAPHPAGLVRRGDLVPDVSAPAASSDVAGVLTPGPA